MCYMLCKTILPLPWVLLPILCPQTLSLKHKSLSKFRLFKWMYQNKHIQCKHFDKVEVPRKNI